MYGELKVHLSIIGLLSCLVSLGATPPESPATEGAALAVQLSTPRDNFTQNEPAVLVIALRNVSSQPQKIEPALEPEWGILGYEIRGPNSEPQKYSPLVHVHGVFQPEELPPDRSLVHRQLLLFSPSEGAHFKTPGTYQVRAVFHTSMVDESRSVLMSNWLPLTVHEAAGVNARALATRRRSLRSV
jgi:hypothetical protein